MNEEVAEARKRFLGIVKEAERLGVPKDRVQNLIKLRKPKKNSTIAHKIPYFLLGTAFMAFVFRAELYSPSGLAAAWLYWQKRDPLSEKCTIWMPDFMLRVLRPPVDCSMCIDVQEIDRISNITPKEFEEIYAFSGRPVVITDAMTNWTAPSIFSFDFFKNIYSDSTVQDRCQFFPYQTEFRSLWQVFQMSDERAKLTDGTDPWYIGWSNCDDKVGRILRQHYDRPYFLPENSENKNVDWIFMGSPGYGAHMHVDNVNHPSWQAQLVGTKNWTLEPPPECIYQCKSHQVTIYAGEIFVLDTNSWYHSTVIVSDGISITIGAEYD